MQLAVKLGQRGTITIPKEIRDQIGLEEGSILVFELREDGVLMRPAIATPLKPEEYSARRKAEFLLNNATDAADYAEARRRVEAMGLDPDDVMPEREVRLRDNPAALEAVRRGLDEARRGAFSKSPPSIGSDASG